MIGGLSRKGAEEEFKFWSKLNVDFIMLSIAYDFFFDDENVEKLVELKKEYGLNILIHPRPDGETLLSPANPDAHDSIFKSLEIIRQAVRQQDFINKVIIHLSTYNIPGEAYKTFTEEEAINNSGAFYKRLKTFAGLNFVLENAYPPNRGWGELGYMPGHFELFDLKEDYEFCLDTGHLNLSGMKIADISKIPLKLTCIHLHSNNGREDQHLPLTRKNFKDWAGVESILSDDKYIVIEVKDGRKLRPQVVSCLRQNKIPP